MKPEAKGWDLWSVILTDGDQIEVKTGGVAIKEIRIHNGIPADRICYVATRQVAWHAEDAS